MSNTENKLGFQMPTKKNWNPEEHQFYLFERYAKKHKNVVQPQKNTQTFSPKVPKSGLKFSCMKNVFSALSFVLSGRFGAENREIWSIFLEYRLGNQGLAVFQTFIC